MLSLLGRRDPGRTGPTPGDGADHCGVAGGGPATAVRRYRPRAAGRTETASGGASGLAALSGGSMVERTTAVERPLRVGSAVY